MTREQLLLDLYRAYKDARRHKRGKRYQLEFEYDLETNLIALRDELYERRYSPRPSTCFIIHDPKMREVFAAAFRDRIVHHLFYNYTYRIFERTFIHDSYSCLKGRGTHFGIARLRHHILNERRNHSRECHVLKIDIRGYFMHIDRSRLLALCRETLGRSGGIAAEDRDFVDYLLCRIVEVDPTRDCVRIGSEEEWALLPRGKSLFSSPEGCGLPIGNLSSQLFSNIYLNVFDQYCKRVLGARHYGRYVDDAYFVSCDRVFLLSLVPCVREFLRERLGLEVSAEKLCVADVRRGVEFLGVYLLPYRTYIANGALRRMRRKILSLRVEDVSRLRGSLNSYLGVLSHCDSFRLRRLLLSRLPRLCGRGVFTADWLRFLPCCG